MRTRTPTRRPRRSSIGWPARSAIWSRSSAWLRTGATAPRCSSSLPAVRSALNNTAKIILKDHIDHCLADAVETGDQQAIDELNQAIEKFMN